MENVRAGSDGHRVIWFVTDRPVDGGTVYRTRSVELAESDDCAGARARGTRQTD